jgi:hypothetical protein
MSDKDYRIEPPPEDNGNEPLFRVIYIIDVSAPNTQEAAKLTHQIMIASDSMLPVLQVMNSEGKVVRIDLSKEMKG